MIRTLIILNFQNDCLGTLWVWGQNLKKKKTLIPERPKKQNHLNLVGEPLELLTGKGSWSQKCLPQDGGLLFKTAVALRIPAESEGSYMGILLWPAIVYCVLSLEIGPVNLVTFFPCHQLHFFKIKINFYVFVCLYMCVHICASRCFQRLEEGDWNYRWFVSRPMWVLGREQMSSMCS